MDFTDKVRKLKEVLDLPSEPVGVRYTDEAPEKREEGYYTVCGGIPAASNGKTILLSEQDCACFGGIRHLGLAKREEGGVPGELLVEGEKLWADLTSYHRSSKTTGEIAEPPYNLGENVVLYPLSEELYNPDLVLVIENAEQACRLVTLNQFWDGKSPSMEMRGSLCWS
ncbi:hypothetical protein AKJ57_01815 [candidate division MSBL1 archaeon SCGC-AAA259A05]|uniref:Uncharacterized protein n=1 Tax=candidate division MSBL1 archaeon SCGC-AAA259A05 TaxID=1698259 RepID=A0A133UAR7_9EURY|nr:hypothetical protein AKJ57_01815 [candidate division MSBL1 archaeon SCGC-AAA259A05]